VTTDKTLGKNEKKINGSPFYCLHSAHVYVAGFSFLFLRIYVCGWISPQHMVLLEYQRNCKKNSIILVEIFYHCRVGLDQLVRFLVVEFTQFQILDLI
jgi:hypothetical protein